MGGGVNKRRVLFRVFDWYGSIGGIVLNFGIGIGDTSCDDISIKRYLKFSVNKLIFFLNEYYFHHFDGASNWMMQFLPDLSQKGNNDDLEVGLSKCSHFYKKMQSKPILILAVL